MAPPFILCLLTGALPMFSLASATTPVGLSFIPPVTESGWNVDAQTVFIFELAISLLVIVFIAVFIIGRHQNLTLAVRIGSTLCTALSQQFTQFGNAGKVLSRDGHSFFWFYATGRRHTTGLTVAINLAARVDMFSYTSAFMATPQKDRLTFYLPISNLVQMDPLTLFLVKRKELTRLRSFEDGRPLATVETIAAQVVDVPAIPTDFVIMTEHPDIATTLLPEPMRDLIARQRAHLVSVHVTDQGAEWDPQCSMAKRLIRLECVLPKTDVLQDALLCDMAQLAMHLVDAVANTRLSPAARKKASDLRKQVVVKREKQEQKARAEEAAERRLEKKKQEEEAVGKMSAEKQRKYEEKKRKKEINSRMRKVTKK